MYAVRCCGFQWRLSGTGLTVSAGTFGHVAAECFCPESDCGMDPTADGELDCFTAAGAVCTGGPDPNGKATTCPSRDVGGSFAYVFSSDGAQLNKPFVEIDNDGDGFVECTEFDLSTYRQGGGSFSVEGGLDCDDYDGYVYPAATEYCDGQYNDCENVAYDDDLAPADETDDDGDDL